MMMRREGGRVDRQTESGERSFRFQLNLMNSLLQSGSGGSLTAAVFMNT